MTSPRVPARPDPLWEWFKLRGRWMPWIMLAIAVVAEGTLAQLREGMWFAYAAYHNETLQEIHLWRTLWEWFKLRGRWSMLGIAVFRDTTTRAEEVDGEEVEGEINISVSCISLANEGMPRRSRSSPKTFGPNSSKTWRDSATRAAPIQPCEKTCARHSLSHIPSQAASRDWWASLPSSSSSSPRRSWAPSTAGARSGRR